MTAGICEREIKMSKTVFKPGTMLNPVPAVMVSCGDDTVNNIITIAWTGIINSDPPITYVSVRKSRYSHDIIERTGEFVINLTTEKLAFAADYCGVRSGRDVDKFKEMKLTAAESKEVSCPSIEESPVNIEMQSDGDEGISDARYVHCGDSQCFGGRQPDGRNRKAVS